MFLLPEYEDPTSQKEVLERSWPGLFEAMLEGWVTDEEYWPENRTLDMFLEWFELQMVAAVQDLASDTVLSENSAEIIPGLTPSWLSGQISSRGV